MKKQQMVQFDVRGAVILWLILFMSICKGGPVLVWASQCQQRGRMSLSSSASWLSVTWVRRNPTAHLILRGGQQKEDKGASTPSSSPSSFPSMLQHAREEAVSSSSSPTTPSMVERNEIEGINIFQTTAAAATITSSMSRSGAQELLSYFVWTLLGSMVVWHLFFYLLSVGYAVGIGLPVLVALFQHRTFTVHAALVVLWSIRLAAFLLWREYVAWPAWHERIQQVAHEQRAAVPRIHRYLITATAWVAYAVLYFFLALPALTRLQTVATVPTGTITTSTLTMQKITPRSFLFSHNWIPCMIQMTGLALESVADWQKSQYKRLYPRRWCHEGLWKFTSHPNYAGEWLFWFGTLLGGIFFPRKDCRLRDMCTLLAMLAGFAFISTVLQGAVETLDKAQRQKYAQVPEYLNFVAECGVAGPRLFVYKRTWSDWYSTRQARRLARSAVPLVENNATTINNSTSSDNTFFHLEEDYNNSTLNETKPVNANLKK